jgi:hypothetical protein
MHIIIVFDPVVTEECGLCDVVLRVNFGLGRFDRLEDS